MVDSAFLKSYNKNIIAENKTDVERRNMIKQL